MELGKEVEVTMKGKVVKVEQLKKPDGSIINLATVQCGDFEAFIVKIDKIIQPIK